MDTLILINTTDPDASNNTKEAISVANKISQQYSTVIIGKSEETLSYLEELDDICPNKIIGTNTLLNNQSLDLWVASYEQIIRKTNPKIILLVADVLTREISARLAARLNIPLIQESSQFEIKNNSLKFTRPIFGGIASATIQPNETTQLIVTLQKGAFRLSDIQKYTNCRTTYITLELQKEMEKVEYGELSQTSSKGLSMEKASSIVCGGRGIGGPEGFELLSKLANLLDNGVIGASRAACDAGWIDHSYQIGLTGRNVSPNLYFAIGISGASQHMVGCIKSKTIVAINKDPSALIFNDADIGIIGEWQKIIPLLIEKIQSAK
jgi:electron transfer flavoprotein alpha subunit